MALSGLIVALVFLLLISAFFSGSETAMMAANRYRLRHLVREGNKKAKRVLSLLERPDRLLGTILIGNTFANILAASLTTILAVRLFGDVGLFFSTILLTLLVLIFSEVTPKTLAALYPDSLSFFVAIPLRAISIGLYPLVLIVNLMANGFLRCFGIKLKKNSNWQLTQEELRTLVNDTGYHILGRNKNMLLRLIDLKQVTVDDIMVPRSEIVGIDLAEDWQKITQQLNLTQHTRLPVYQGDINQIKGIVHIRSLLPLVQTAQLTLETLRGAQQEPYFVPEGTPLTTQLMNFQYRKARVAFVVDEYGDIQGLVTLDDILEEVVGEFTTDIAALSKDIYEEEGGSFLIDGSANVRELNRSMGWELPIDGPKTINGLILEYLEVIPEPGSGCRLSGYPIEIIQIKDNAVKTARIYPNLRQK